MKRNRWLRQVVLILSCIVLMMSSIGCLSLLKSEPRSSSEKQSKAKKRSKKQTQKATTAETTEEQTYEHNEYYDLVEELTCSRSGFTYYYHIIEGNRDGYAKGTAIAYDENGKVIGKSENEIPLTKGDKFFFKYWFEGDVADVSFSVECSLDEIVYYYRNTMKVSDSNVVADITGQSLYVTVEQIKEFVGENPFLYALFYKDGKVVGDGFMNIEGLNGINSTAVVKVTPYLVFDSYELYIKPGWGFS